jgi:hypothetical protein
MASSVVETYFVVHGHVTATGLKAGFRRMLYVDAAHCHAYHDFRMDTDRLTIYYKDASDDKLYFSLLFKNEDNAHKFQTVLYSHNENLDAKQRFTFNQDFEKFQTNSSVHKAKYVYLNDYKERFVFPTYKRSHYKDFETKLDKNDQIQSLRSFENLTLIPWKLPIFQCQIAPNTYYKGLCESDPDNVIYSSHTFWCYFQGDGLRRPYGADWDWGYPPHLWIDFVGIGSNTATIDEVTYHEVIVDIMFPDVEVANCMRSLWKEGTKEIGDNGFRSSFYTTNVENTKQYLAWRKHETRLRWGVQDDMITPLNATMEELELGELEEAILNC